MADITEGHIGSRQDQPHHQVRHVAGLCGRLLQEFQAYRRIEKQIADDESGSLRASSLLYAFNASAIIRNLHAACVSFGARRTGHLRNSSNGGQRFTAETQRLDSMEVLGIRNLAGRMTFESQADLALGNAAAIVCHAEIADAAVTDFDSYRGCTSVKAVFHHFLDGRRRAFNHLARRNLTNDLV